MSEYIVRAGDCISSIAARHGMLLEDIWDHADNQELRERRTDPNLLCEGDRLVLPDAAAKYESLSTGQEHPLVLRNTLVLLRLKLVRNGEPLTGDYSLDISGRIYEGTLSDGSLEEHVPAGTREARLLMLATNELIVLQLGELDPADTPRGALERLRNLGLVAAKTSRSTRLDGAARHILRLIQREDGLEETGELDPATADALIARYGC
jgi:hypothetical protein